ncbi:MAG: N-methyl-L-tryptophan oxidase [Chloroflexi bacterium]|nr:N-methyl-L-tryptophan oxidase [Chloroflexota bacterium]
MPQVFDAIVIGAGAMGSAATYYLRQRGQRVLLLEQFALDHRQGSSYGHSRIIRYAYDHPEYVELAKDTFPLWFDVQDKLGEQLVVQTGGLDFGPPGEASLEATIAAMRASGLPYELLTPAEASARFPQFRLADDFKALYQPESGFVKASKAVLGHINLAKAKGAVVKEGTAVTAIDVGSNSVAVSTANEAYSAGRLIVTAGAWAKRLLQQTGLDLPLAPLRCQLNFMAPTEMAPYQAENCPVWIAHVAGLFPESIYGIPSHGGSGFKIAFHGGPAYPNPAEISREPDEENVAALRPFMRAHIPGIAGAPVRESRICLYTQTPDEHFIVDKHPEHAHVAIGAGFSGHGFKFSTTVGKMLCEIALDGDTPHNDSLFKIARFTG